MFFSGKKEQKKHNAVRSILTQLSLFRFVLLFQTCRWLPTQVLPTGITPVRPKPWLPLRKGEEERPTCFLKKKKGGEEFPPMIGIWQETWSNGKQFDAQRLFLKRLCDNVHHPKLSFTQDKSQLKISCKLAQRYSIVNPLNPFVPCDGFSRSKFGYPWHWTG